MTYTVSESMRKCNISYQYSWDYRHEQAKKRIRCIKFAPNTGKYRL